MLGQLIRLPTLFGDFIALQRKKRHCTLAPGAVLLPASRISNHRSADDIVIGKGSRVLAELLTFGHGGRINIGERCFIGENTRIWSADSIRIGNRVLISHGVNIHDTNSHSDSAVLRAAHFDAIFDGGGHPRSLPDVKSAPILIGDDAWIGCNAVVLKGVTIGEGAIVGACAFVTRDVEPFTMVGGHPARVIRRLTDDR